MANGKKSITNNPTTIHYKVVRASTLEEWREVRNLAHAYIEKRWDTAKGDKAAEDALDHDEEYAMYNSIGVLAHEIVEMRRLAEKLVNPRAR